MRVGAIMKPCASGKKLANKAGNAVKVQTRTAIPAKIAIFYNENTNNADLDQTPHYATFDQGIHCFLTEGSIKI